MSLGRFRSALRRRPAAGAHATAAVLAAAVLASWLVAAQAVGSGASGLVHVRVRPGPETIVTVQVAAPNLTWRSVTAGSVAHELALIDRDRTIHMWLNGRPVTRALVSSVPTRWTATLSATHGLRYGVNTLRVTVRERASGRSQSVTRRFTVRRTHELASAGWDIATRAGETVQLDGRGSRTIEGGRPRLRWRVISGPGGSRAALRAAHAARPLFTPRRPGEYVIGLTATGAAASAHTADTDKVTVTAEPPSLLVPFVGYTHQDGKPGIRVGDKFYANPSPDASSMQWLTLDRSTLQPAKVYEDSDPSKRLITDGTDWFDGTASGAHGLATLTSAFKNGGLNDLVVLSYPFNGHAPPVQSDQIEHFNEAMKMIGVDEIASAVLQDRNKLVIVGIPYGGPSSGWYSHGGVADADGLKGWLMPDAQTAASGALRYRFSPDRPAFDTSSSHTALSNTMTVGSQRIDDALPPGATGGFQVALIDPTNFSVLRHAAIPTNSDRSPGSPDPFVGRQALIIFLGQNSGNNPDLLMQSIGHVQAAADQFDKGPDVEWQLLSTALQSFGANPDTFYRADGSYAFFGGKALTRSEAVDSSSQVKLNPNVFESGTLRGRASIRHDGYHLPVQADPAEKFTTKLYDLVFTASTAWPLTEAAGEPHWEAYKRALTYISEHLPLTKDTQYKFDLRDAYAGNPNLNYSDAKVDLTRPILAYPGEAEGFSRAEYKRLKEELQDEFDWLDNTQTLFDAYKEALRRGINTELTSLTKIGNRLRDQINPDGRAEIGWSVGAFLGQYISAGLVVTATGPEGVAALAVWEAFVAAYELIKDLVSGSDGNPVGDQLQTKVQDLAEQVAARQSDTEDGVDRLRQVIISDYGRLRALGSVAPDASWKVDIPAINQKLIIGANAFFSTQLLPLVYGVQQLRGAYPYNWDGNPDSCHSYGYGYPFKGASDRGNGTVALKWDGHFTVTDGDPGWPSEFILGKRDGETIPPKDLTDAMFLSPEQKGYGIRLSQFMWTAYDHPAPPTDIVFCH